MRESYPSISVVIPTWNGLSLLKIYLDDIIRKVGRYPGLTEVIVVDDGSNDRTADILDYFYPNIQVVRLNENRGYGAACNAGIEKSSYGLVLLLNNDVVIEDHTIPSLVDKFEELVDPFALSPVTYTYKPGTHESHIFSSHIYFRFAGFEFQQVWGVSNGDILEYGNLESLYITGAVALIDRSKFLLLNGFDPIYGKAYWEDIDLCTRARSCGWSSYVTTESFAYHYVSASSGEDTYFKQYQMTRNNIIYNLIYLPQYLVSKYQYSLFSRLTSSEPISRQLDMNTLILKDIELYMEEISLRRNQVMSKVDQCLPTRLMKSNDYPGWSSPCLLYK